MWGMPLPSRMTVTVPVRPGRSALPEVLGSEARTVDTMTTVATSAATTTTARSP